MGRMPSLASHDFAAIGLVVVGLICQLVRGRLPRFAGSSLFCALTTIGLGVAVYYNFPAPTELPRSLAFVSTMCFLWAMLAYFVAAQAEQVSHDTEVATFFAWSLVCGIAGATICLYLLVFSTWPRILDPQALGDGLPVSGLPCIGGLLTAAVCWNAARRDPHQPVVLLALGGLFVWWSSLVISSGVGAYPRGTPLLAWQPAWWTWTLQLQAGLSLLLVVATVMQDSRYRRRRAQAWPNRLDHLTAPYSRWPAYIQTEAVLAAIVLVAGVYQIVRSGPPSWPLHTVSAMAALSAGLVCLFMTYRRWSANTAELGMALLTLCAANCACAIVEAWMTPAVRVEYAVRIPILFNAVLIALLAMIALWRWLAAFWRQQLLDGSPWTTAGRMIPCSKRTAFLLSALAVLVAYRMALWPQSSPTGHEDTAGGRMIAGVVTIALLCLQQTRSGRREGSVASACLAVALGAAAILFAFIRMPASPIRGWILQYDSVVYSAISLPILAVAEAIPKSKWRAFAGPLWMIALLILPVAALVDLLVSPLPADWVRPLTLALLGALYSFAAGRENRRAFLILGAALLIASLTSFYGSYHRVIMEWVRS
jgi:hypothetical protein